MSKKKTIIRGTCEKTSKFGSLVRSRGIGEVRRTRHRQLGGLANLPTYPYLGLAGQRHSSSAAENSVQLATRTMDTGRIGASNLELRW